MRVISRQEWGAAPPRSWSPRRATRYVLLHHTAGPNADLSLEQEIAYQRQMQRFHMVTRGWADIGQHWTVMRSGRVFEGRPEHVIGSHCPGRNSDSVGIEVQGTFLGGAQPSAAQVQALGELVGEICRRYSLDPRRAVSYHRAWYSTQCPGDLVSRIPEIVAIAERAGVSSSRRFADVNIWQPQQEFTGFGARQIFVGYLRSDYRVSKADLLQTAWLNVMGAADNVTFRFQLHGSDGGVVAGPWEVKLRLNQKAAFDLWAMAGTRNLDGAYSWWSSGPVRIAETVYVVPVL